MKKKVWLLLFGISLVTMGAGVATMPLLSAPWSNWMIVKYGIRIFRQAIQLSKTIALAGTIATIVCSLPLFKRLFTRSREQVLIDAQQERRKQSLADFARGDAELESIREALIQLQMRPEMQEFEQVFVDCMAQVDRLENLRQKQLRLIEANSATYLEKTIPAFDAVTKLIGSNFRVVNNACIIADDYASLDQNELSLIFGQNNDILEDARELVKESKDWINQYNINHNAANADILMNWVETIQEKVKEWQK